MEELAGELYMEPYDCYSNGDNSHLTGELEMLVEEMRLLIAGNVYDITLAVKKSFLLQNCGEKS